VNKRWLLLFAIVAIVTIAGVTVYLSLPREKLFKLDADWVGTAGAEWYYTLWYNGNEPLTDVHVLVDGEEGITYSVLPPNYTEAVLRWTCGVQGTKTVDIQWNGGRQVFSFS
jgi:hypothetical protein